MVGVEARVKATWRGVRVRVAVLCRLCLAQGLAQGAGWGWVRPGGGGRVAAGGGAEPRVRRVAEQAGPV